MSTRHLLVDLESVQPEPAVVASWIGEGGSAWIFHGPHQLKMLPKYTSLGPSVTVVPISRTGKNSLDFHLVFYLGYLTACNPEDRFAVLSKDKGYDPAITHARTLKFDLRRMQSLGKAGADAEPVARATKAAAPKKAPASTPDVATKKVPGASKAANKSPRALGAIYRDVLEGLRTQTSNRPKSRRELEQHVQTRLGTEPAPDKVQSIVDRLFTTEAVRLQGGRLVYFAADLSEADQARMRVWPVRRRAAA